MWIAFMNVSMLNARLVKLFWNGNSQAFRLHAEFCFDEDEI